MSLRTINSIVILDSIPFATAAGDNHDVAVASSNYQVTPTNDGDAITGLSPSCGAEDGAQCWLTNASATNTLVLKNNDSGSTAGFRFILPLGNLTLAPGASQHFGLAPSVGWIPISGASVSVAKTVTAGGVTGAVTINKQAGSVNFAAAASSVVVTNSLVTANSIIITSVASNDTTMRAVRHTQTAGSFTIFANATPTAETRVNFLVL
jgi:hypothetical protein